MALVYPNASGSYETVANWYSGGSAYGSLPLAGDTICLNGNTVTIDATTTLTVTSTAALAGITTVATAPAAAGGGLSIVTGGFDVIATTIQVGTTTPITINHSTGTVSITATDILGSTTNSFYGVNIVGGGIVNINANVTGGSVITALGIRYAGTGTLNYTGELTSGTHAAAYGLYAAGSGTINITGGQYSKLGSTGACIGYTGSQVINIVGDIYSPNAPAGSGYVLLHTAATTATINITGNVYFGTNASVNHLVDAFVATNVIGNVTGGGIAGKYCLTGMSTSIPVTVNGDVTGGSNATGYAIYSVAASIITVIGTVTAGTANAIYNSSSASVLKLQGNIVNVGLVSAIFSPVLQISDATVQTWIVRNSSNDADRTLYTNPAGMPIEADVREGELYGSTNEFEGTLIVPAKSSVLTGIGTDDGVGTLVQSFDYGAIADIVGVVVENNFP